MKNIIVSFRSLFRKGRHNGFKILSLGVGLAVGMVLIAKVCFEVSFDNFYPEASRIYNIRENVSVGDRDLEAFHYVSGGVALGMKAEIPGVEAATRCQRMGVELILTPDKNKYKARFIMADSCFFDVLPREILVGNATEVLSRPLYALVSEHMAEVIGKGKDVVGTSFEMASFPGIEITIGGIFKNVPKNTHLYYDIAVSLSSLRKVSGWSNEDDWFGGDSYAAYVRLAPGLRGEALEKPMAEMLDRHVDSEKLKENGINYSLFLTPLEKVYASSPETKQMAVMLLLIAFAIIFASLMNYVLLEISSLVTRSKDIAVHKCYGASGKSISNMIFSETFLNLILSIIIAILLIFAFRGIVEEQLNTSLRVMFTLNTILLLAGVCLLVFLLATLLPSQLFSRIPVATVFRSYTESRRSWKKVLLFIQFIAVGFLVSLLAIIGLQYERMITDDPGYSYDRLAYCRIDGVKSSARKAVINELNKLPEVEGVATCENLPMRSSSGDIVYREGTDESVLHFVDLYEADINYIPLMEMDVIQGKAFDESYTDSSRVMMVSRMMADKLAIAMDWKDGVVGKTLRVSGHSDPSYEVIGVYDDIRTDAINSELMAPSALFYGNYAARNLVIKFHNLTAENLKKADVLIKGMLPDKDVSVVSYSVGMKDLYADSLQFRNSVLLGGIITLIITLVGLIGYISDETNRRGKEIAVRKINGATEKNILSLISLDVLYMALPAVIIGTIISRFVGEKWLQQFSEKIPLSTGLFIFCSVVVIVVILATVVYRSWQVAIANPVLSLKSE